MLVQDFANLAFQVVYLNLSFCVCMEVYFTVLVVLVIKLGFVVDFEMSLNDFVALGLSLFE